MTTGMGINGTMDMVHLSNMSDCSSLGKMNIGEGWSVRADYDFNIHSPMLNDDGTVAPVMGIGLLYVAKERNLSNDANC